MKTRIAALAAACIIGCAAAAHAQRPDLSGNWIANGGKTAFGPWHLTEDGERRFKAYDFKKIFRGCLGSGPPPRGTTATRW